MSSSKKISPKEAHTDLAMVGTPAYYENILKQHPHDQKAYERLMVLYRQQKDYRKELRTINTAIKVFEELYAPPKTKGRKVNTISHQLNKVLGLVDKQGKQLYEQKPISTWKQRRLVVLKKMK